MFNFIYINKIDGSGGFMIPEGSGSEEIINELLKNSEYIIGKGGDSMGKISVNIQREDRLRAIVELSIAIRKVSEALTTPVQVNLTGCTITSQDIGVSIETPDRVNREEIIETE